MIPRNTQLLAAIVLHFAAAAGAADLATLREAPWTGTWYLARIQDTSPSGPLPISLTLKGDEFGAFDGCNGTQGLLEAEPGTLRFQSEMSTLVLCLPGSVMKQADRFNNALSKSRRYRLEDGRLHLLDQRGLVLATFDRPVRRLEDSRWTIVGYRGSDDDLEKDLRRVELAPITVTFGPRRFQLSTLCTSLTGRYASTRGDLRFVPPLSPRWECNEGPQGVASETSTVLAALPTVEKFALRGNHLELFAADRRLMLRLLSDGPLKRERLK